MDVEVKKRKAIPNCPFFFGFKLYNLCQINEPFLYLDCDAVPLSNLNHLWTIRKDKPFIGANHQKVKGHTEHVDPGFLNSGVLVVGDPSFLSFEKIFSKVSLQKLPSVPGGDQRILYGFCKAVGYDYQHPQMDTSWNSCSGLTHFVDLSRTEAICKSDGKKVNVNHYWADFKPWQIDCPLFDYFVQSIDHN
jgi:lipopolysaccharide biosynthesis glycosyltransferase